MSIKLQDDQESKYIHKVYRNISCLGILLHVVFSFVFGILKYKIPFTYNILDIIFYTVILFIVTKKSKYALTVSLIHLETIVFCVLHTMLFGWEPAFYIYLIAMASLVYFCPYRALYIPYLFSFLHIIVFFLLYFFSIHQTFTIESNEILKHTFFTCNGIAAFVIILYVGYVSKASAFVGRKELLEKNKDLQHLADYDQMTGLYSRACLRNRFTQYCGKKNVLAIGDIDDFKHINDTYGHICGDVILKELAEQMRAKLDPNIFMCRWGGEEFVFLFPERSIHESKEQLEDFCNWIEHFDFHYQDLTIHFTMTFGIRAGQNNRTLDKWIEDADQLLYKGKHSGKNIVISK